MYNINRQYRLFDSSIESSHLGIECGRRKILISLCVIPEDVFPGESLRIPVEKMHAPCRWEFHA